MADGSVLEQTPDAFSITSLRPSQRHITALDGLRGLAIVMVMFQHFTVVERGIPIDRAFGAIGRFGWTGVDLFFLLSGFLITGILLNSRQQAHYFRNFYARRILRIFPAYYLLVVFGLFIAPHLSLSANENFRPIPKSHWPYFLTYFGNFPIGFTRDRLNDFFGITWSLAIEEQFYLVWPLIVFFCKPKTIIKICIGLVLFSLALRTTMVITFLHNGPGDADRNKVYVLTPCRLDAIAIGSMIAAVVYRRGLQALRDAMPWMKKALIVSLVGIAICCAAHKSTGWGLGPGQTFGYTCVAVMYAVLLSAILIGRPEQLLGRFFTSAPLRFMGKYSYAIYLIHMPIMRCLKSYWYGPDKFWTIHGSQIPGQCLFYLMCFPPAIIGGLISWNLMEKHLLKLKKYFPTHPPVEPRRVLDVQSLNEPELAIA